MTDNAERRENMIDTQPEIKVEPALQCSIVEEHENGFSNFETAVAIPSYMNMGTLNLWTSKATTCLINQYKMYRSMVGQTTQIRSLREMFEMISLEMQNYGFYFSPQKCENKWRVLERKYKNIVSRERLKKPGRIRHYGHWEHKRALDEIFNEKKKRVYLKENEPQAASDSAKHSSIQPKFDYNRGRQQEDLLTSSLTSDAVTNKRNNEETPAQQQTLTIIFEKFLEEIAKNLAVAENNKERRHKEKIAVRQKELELNNKFLKLKEQKMELQRCQIIAAAQNLNLNRK